MWLCVYTGTSFIFYRDQPVCKTLHFDVGILTPDWLKDSKYLGQTATDNFVTNVWTKAKFINYFADKVSSSRNLLRLAMGVRGGDK